MIFFVLLACATPENPITRDMVRVEFGADTFYIDKYEYPNQAGQKPTAHMNLDMAKAACATQGKRLCTAREWRAACIGTQNLRFGYGNDYAGGRCKSNVHLKSGHNSMKDIEASISGSGEFTECHNDLGIYDMIGNLEEWVLDDFNGRSGSLEGGAFYTYREYADCSGRYSRQPDFRLTTDKITDSAGARCCFRERPIEDADLQPITAQHSNNIDDIEYVSENEILLSSGVRIDQYEYPNALGGEPLTHVSWEEADRLCQKAGKKLCSAEVWEEACTNGGATNFPYGNHFIPQKCPAELEGIAQSGDFPDCRNTLGVQDLTGGVWEWIGEAQFAPKLNENTNSARYELRGGSWYTDSEKARCRPTSGYPLALGTAKYPDVGFRCCRGEAKTKTQSQRIDPDLNCPKDMAPIQKSCIDRYEYPNKAQRFPKVDVSIADAQALCRQQQKHLCTSQEWLDACEGPEGNRWSYGSQYDPSKCHHNAPDGLGKAQLAGLFADCQTTAGVFDLTGNVWEWTMEGEMYGGSWNFSSGMGQCRASAHPATGYKSHEIGFRCCASKEETLVLLNSTDDP